MSSHIFAIKNLSKNVTPEYIANVFWNQNLARISTIVLGKDVNNEPIALVYVSQFGESESAYNLIKRLKTRNTARVIHSSDLAWDLIKYYYGLEQELFKTTQIENFSNNYYLKSSIIINRNDEIKTLINRNYEITLTPPSAVELPKKLPWDNNDCHDIWGISYPSSIKVKFDSMY
jgi:hypothetical protein